MIYNERNCYSSIKVTDYCFNDNKDVVWEEGTVKMDLAFGIAYLRKEKYIFQKNLIKQSNSPGFS